MRKFFNKIFNRSSKKYHKVTTKTLPVKLKLEALNDKEIDYIQNNLGLVEEILKDLSFEIKDHQFEPERIDKAIFTWFSADLQTRFGTDVNMYSNALAVGWGNYLEKKLKMNWKVITNEFGTEIGLYHEVNDTIIFPFKSTAKAFNNKDFGLLSTITKEVEEILNK